LAHFIDFVLVVQILFAHGSFDVVVYVFDEEKKLRWFHEDKWLIENEFVENFSFKISSPPPAHRICGFNLFISCVTSAYRGFSYVYIEIRNNTSGRSFLCQAFVFPMRYKRDVREIQSLLHRKLGGNDPTFDNGDDVSISVRPHGPIQVRTIGIRWLHEEEGKDDDIQSKDEVINAHNSSDDAAHVPKVEIASHFFRNYYCAAHRNETFGDFAWLFAKTGLEFVLYYY
jgi:hypothetical protein